MEIRPIRSEQDHAEAIREIEKLLGFPEGSPEADRLEVIATLVADYEDRHHPIDPPDPIEAIKFRLDQAGLTEKDLEPILGTRARVYEILNKRRSLSLNMIRHLVSRFGIPADVLLPAYRLCRPRLVRTSRKQPTGTRRPVRSSNRAASR